jgi:ketol-acid reductoisomerase
MASRSFSKTLRSPLARQVASPRVQQRSFTAARGLVRAVAAARPAVAVSQQQVRGVKTIDFAGVKEDVYGELAIAHRASRGLPSVLTEY